VCAYRAPWPAEAFAAGGDLDAAALARAGETVTEMVEEARAAEPGTVVTGTAVCGTPVSVLAAAATDGSTLVVGSRGHGGFGSLLLGSTGLQLATHASGPVVVVRGRTDGGNAPVLVGTDGSAGADTALGMAFDAAATHGCVLSAVRAYHQPTARWGQPVDPVASDDEYLRAAEESALHRSLEPWREKYPRVQVETILTHGDAASVLIALSTTAQLVVVGTRGHGGFAGLLLGSVGQKLLHHAHCPVLIARGAA
jgi:nucleotide-binding universal stress UspA family protein